MIDEILLVIAVSIDTFIMALSCGMDCIKIPLKSSIGVGVVGSIMMIVSILLSDVICQHIPSRVCAILSCIILCAMGVMNILKYFFDKYRKSKHIGTSSLETTPIVDVYLCGSSADCDKSKEISVREAVTVSFLMSIDTVSTGIVSGNHMDVTFLGISALVVQSLTVWLGSILGMKFSKFPDVSLLGGLSLITLGVLKAF